MTWDSPCWWEKSMWQHFWYFSYPSHICVRKIFHDNQLPQTNESRSVWGMSFCRKCLHGNLVHKHNEAYIFSWKPTYLNETKELRLAQVTKYHTHNQKENTNTTEQICLLRFLRKRFYQMAVTGCPWLMKSPTKPTFRCQLSKQHNTQFVYLAPNCSFLSYSQQLVYNNTQRSTHATQTLR